MTSDPLSVGVVGLGYGRAHIPAFQAHGCRVVAVCQRDRAAAKAVADRYGVPQAFERWEDMLVEARPAIVVIATPPHLHRAIAVRAFDVGAHVLCEKPLAMSRAEADRMLEAARRAGRVAMTDFNWRFTAAMQELVARVQSGAVGRLLHVSAHWLGGRWAVESAPPTWRMDMAQAGAGAMGDMGVHLIDLIRSTFGEFRRVVAQAGIAYPSRSAPGVGRAADAEDYCSVIAELDHGLEATLCVSRVAHGMNDHGLEAFGSQGALLYRLTRPAPRWWEGELRASGGGPFERVQPRVPSSLAGDEADPMDTIGKATIAPLVARFLEAIRAGTSPSPSFADGAAAQAVLDAVLESARRRRWVDL